MHDFFVKNKIKLIKKFVSNGVINPLFFLFFYRLKWIIIWKIEEERKKNTKSLQTFK